MDRIISERHSAWKHSISRIHQTTRIFLQQYSDLERSIHRKVSIHFPLTNKSMEMENENLTLEIKEISLHGPVHDHLQVLMELIRLVEKHYRQHRRPKFYSHALSIKTVILNKHCKRIFRKSVYELVQDKVHDEAIKLLVYTDWPIKRISYEMGCNDPGYFNRCFKKKTGYSPKKYRLSGLGMEQVDKSDRKII